MVRYTGPKNRVARRFGANIFGRLRNPLLHKPNPPGMHGAKKKKKSDFGVQLEEQQKLKAVYGMMTQKQLVNTYKKALKVKGNTAQQLLERLECRLDNVVYRLKFARTIFGAGQLVSHGHILVDGKKVDRRSFYVRPGMVISVKPKSKEMASIKESLASSVSVPDYFTHDLEKVSGSLLVPPQIDQVPLPLPINIVLICEHLAHVS